MLETCSQVEVLGWTEGLECRRSAGGLRRLAVKRLSLVRVISRGDTGEDPRRVSLALYMSQPDDDSGLFIFHFKHYTKVRHATFFTILFTLS